jgi:hypothetical protein
MDDVHAAIEARGNDQAWIHRLSRDEVRAQVESARGWEPEDAYSRHDATGPCGAPGRQFRFGVPQPHQLEFYGDGKAGLVFQHAVEALRTLGATGMAMPEERAPAPYDSMATGKIGPTPVDPPS